ncbi:Nefh [Symbiodinium natans]|uniref:Nefh protein n=1 Tax=Symbiodinium natans TaxID=878477 RepID=A0A812NSB4_9DINO|nr:Nefh [Symbiodinium natans]
MQRSRLNRDHISFNSSISACGRGGAWIHALRLSRTLPTAGLSCDVVTLNAGISACETLGCWTMALAILRDMCDGVKLNLVTFGAMLSTARRAAAWEVVLASLLEMRPRSLHPNEVCCNAALSALRAQRGKWAAASLLAAERLTSASTSLVLSSLLGQGGQGGQSGQGQGAWREVFRLFLQWEDMSILPTVAAMNAGITACHKSSRWELSLSMLDKMMSSSDLRPDAITCASTLGGCERGQRWQLTALLLRAFRRLSTRLDLAVHHAALSAAAKGHAWRSATDAVHEAMQRGFLSSIAINTAAFACQSAKRWRWSFELSGQLRTTAVRPDHFAVTSLLASAWPVALHSLEGFDLLLLKPDDLACSSILTTLSVEECWQRALLLKQRFPTDMGDALACDALTSACETSRGIKPLPALLEEAAFVLRQCQKEFNLNNRAQEQKKIWEALGMTKAAVEIAAPATGEAPAEAQPAAEVKKEDAPAEAAAPAAEAPAEAQPAAEVKNEDAPAEAAAPAAAEAPAEAQPAAEVKNEDAPAEAASPAAAEAPAEAQPAAEVKSEDAPAEAAAPAAAEAPAEAQPAAEVQKEDAPAEAAAPAAAEAPAEAQPAAEVKKEDAPVEAAAPAAAEAPAEAQPAAEVKKEDAPAVEETPAISDELLAQLKTAFDAIDTNGSKFIEASELKTALGKLKVELSEDQVDEVFKSADINKDGKLSFDEYKKLVCTGMSLAQ